MVTPDQALIEAAGGSFENTLIAVLSLVIIGAFILLLKGYLAMPEIIRSGNKELCDTLTKEMKNMVEPSATTISIKEGDIVEMIGSTLKGEKAKVLRIDKQKEEVVVSLFGAVVPLPVTVKIDNIKVIRREDLEDDN